MPTSQPSTGELGAASEVYHAFIADELAELRAVKASMEQRAVMVITTSGVLVTLLLGLAALVSEREDFRLPEDARPFVLLALALFAAAAVLALVVNIPRGHNAPQIDGLRRVLKHQWHDQPWVARRRVGVTMVDAMESYKTRNRWKAGALKLAIGAEAAAVGFVALAVAIVIQNS